MLRQYEVNLLIRPEVSSFHHSTHHDNTSLTVHCSNDPILLVGKQRQQDFTRNGGAPLGWQSSDLTCFQKACQFHSTLSCRDTGTAMVCGPCQFMPLYSTHSHPFLEGERNKGLCESNLVRKPFIFPFPTCMTIIITKLMKDS